MSKSNNKATKRVSSGTYVDLGNLSIYNVDIKDINNSLNYIYRFTGHYKDKPPLTVAQHTKLVVRIAKDLFPDEPAVHFDCLLHDFSEAYYGDIATPLKRLFGDTYRDYANAIDDVVYKKLWRLSEPFSEEVYNKRKICDLLSLDIERRAMWKDQSGKELWPDIPNERFYTQKTKLEMFDEIQSERFVDLIGMYDEMLVHDRCRNMTKDEDFWIFQDEIKYLPEGWSYSYRPTENRYFAVKPPEAINV